MNIITFIKRLFCKHEYEIESYFHGDIRNYGVGIERCEECGKEIKNEYVVLKIEGEKLIYCNRECRDRFIEDSTQDENICTDKSSNITIK